MFQASSWMRRAAWRGSAALCVTLFAAAAAAEVIDVSLNVEFNDPNNNNSGGTWHVVAKSDGFGLAGLELLLTNIASSAPDSPRGIVNGSDPAGFAIFANPFNPLGFHTVTIGQAPIHPLLLGPGEEQSLFYGVGTLANGAPDYPGKPPGSMSIGPTFTTLSNVQGVPWATGDLFGDPEWDTAARLVSGTFSPGVTPGFFENETYHSSGSTFTSLGDDRNPGNLSAQNIDVNTIVRSNFAGTALPDYNDNGAVDAADYVIWRKTLNQSGAGLAADGNNDGIVDQDDYDLWRIHFGKTAGAGANLSTSTIPEPVSWVMLAFGATTFTLRRGPLWRARGSGRALHRLSHKGLLRTPNS